LVIESAEKKTFFKKAYNETKNNIPRSIYLLLLLKKKKKKTKRIYIRGKRQASQCHLQKNASLSPHV